MKFLRWAGASFLLLLTVISAIGVSQIVRRTRPDSTPMEAAMLTAFGLAAGAGAWLLVRPLLAGRTWRGMLSDPQLRTNPLAQAVVAYACAALIMIAAPKYSLLPAFLAVCAFSVAAAVAGLYRRHWFAHAGLSLLVWVLLLGALDGTAEALSPRSIGEGGMVFLLPMIGFPVLLVAVGLVRWYRRAAPRPESPPSPP